MAIAIESLLAGCCLSRSSCVGAAGLVVQDTLRTQRLLAVAFDSFVVAEIARLVTLSESISSASRMDGIHTLFLGFLAGTLYDS